MCSLPSVVYTKPIEIGDLQGNCFKIVLRNLKMHKESNATAISVCNSADT